MGRRSKIKYKMGISQTLQLNRLLLKSGPTRLSLQTFSSYSGAAAGLLVALRPGTNPSWLTSHPLLSK